MDRQELTNKKIAVAGVGGVGGYLAGMLGRVFPHLTLAARGERAAVLREQGHTLHSEYNGEIHVTPERVCRADELGEQDYIFLCVKNYSLEEMCREVRPHVTDHTVIIPVMNGVNPGERVRELIGKGTVVDALIYIVAFANLDYSITQQGQYARLCVGIQDAGPRQWQRVQEVDAILTEAGIDHLATRDILLEIWRKYILNCAFNVATACYDNTIGQLRDDPVKAKEYETLVWEACRVARAKGVAITREHGQSVIDKFYRDYGYDATSSLQRDMRAGRRSELEVFSGYLVREAKRLGVEVPVSERMYRQMAEKVC